MHTLPKTVIEERSRPRYPWPAEWWNPPAAEQTRRCLEQVAADAQREIDFSRFHFPNRLTFTVPPLHHRDGSVPLLVLRLEVDFPNLKNPGTWPSQPITVCHRHLYTTACLAQQEDPLIFLAEEVHRHALSMLSHEINECLWVRGGRTSRVHQDGYHTPSQMEEALPGEARDEGPGRCHHQGDPK